MQKSLILSLLLFAGIPVARAQLQVEVLPLAGHPFMVSGRNKNDFASVTARLQVSYQRESAPWQPYFAASISALELPLHNKEADFFTMPVLNTSFKVGLNGRVAGNEEKRSMLTAGGGIGVCMLRPDAATLNQNGQETFLGYNTLKDKAWFPEVEFGLRWMRFPKPDLGWYFGIQLITEVLWLRDNGVRYTTEISGTTYSLNFSDIAIWPSLGGVIGWSF